MSVRPPAEVRDPFWHAFTFLGTRYLYDVESGALHRIDQVLSEVAGVFGVYPLCDIVSAMGDRFSPDEIESAYRDIEEMLEAGLLTPVPEGADRDPGCSPALESEEDCRPLKAICLHVSHACNLRCSYCFVAKTLSQASDQSFGTVSAPLQMTAEVGQRAVDLMIRESGRVRQLELDFFGGEPLVNFSAVTEIADYAVEAASRADKRVHFSLTTNATELTPEIVEYMDRMGFSVILSLDGRRETHDRWRRFPDGTGSYAKAVAGISTYLEHSKLRDYYVRGTYTAANLDFAADVRHINELGVDRISMEPVVSAGTADYGISPEDLPTLRHQYELLVEYYCAAASAGRPFEFFHFNLGSLMGQCQERRLLGCGAGYQYLAVTPAGELYPCHQFVGMESFRIGDVWSGINKPEVAERFRRSGVREKPRCRACWARYLCSGGCHAVAYQSTGDISGTDEVACGITRTRLEAALAAYAMASSDR
jgi:uncharacterized protein